MERMDCPALAPTSMQMGDAGRMWGKIEKSRSWNILVYPDDQAILQACAPLFVKWQLLTCPPHPVNARMTSMRLSVGVKNHMKPPPPAPDTLPASAPAWQADS